MKTIIPIHQVSSHSSKQVQDFLMTNQINFVRRQKNSPNVSQAR